MQSSGPTKQKSGESDDTWIPEGYVVLRGPNGEKYIAPEFMLPALDQEFHSNERKSSLSALNAKGTVSSIF
jgi:hypothetical protein